MIKVKATAFVHSISPVMQVGQNNFQKRDLIVNDYWERDGEVHDNFVMIEFTGDKMPLLDSIIPGQRVTFEAMVSGRKYQGRYYTSLRGLSAVPYQPQLQQAPQQQQYPQQAAPAYPQQQYQQAPSYPQAATYPQQQQHGYGNGTPTASNLPFP